MHFISECMWRFYTNTRVERLMAKSKADPPPPPPPPQTASTETMDSGLASALLDTPSTPSHSVGMASHMTPPTASLSVYPLDTTTASLTEVTAQTVTIPYTHTMYMYNVTYSGTSQIRTPLGQKKVS